MRNRWALILIQLFIATLHGLASPAAAAERFYVSLGTSLSVGIQPTPSGSNHRTPVGYADQLAGALKTVAPDVTLRKLGCPGETSVTMIVGGVCSYDQGSQLAQAVAFLQSHQGSIALVTIDVGANDVLPCLAASDVELCVGNALTTLYVALIGYILPALQGSAPGVPIVGMNYYNPFLVVPGLAGPSAALQLFMNSTLAAAYGSAPAGPIPVADVATAFESTLPTNALRICQWTWMCVAPPQGPNIHANVLGYGVIATAFLDQLGRLGPPDIVAFGGEGRARSAGAGRPTSVEDDPGVADDAGDVAGDVARRLVAHEPGRADPQRRRRPQQRLGRRDPAHRDLVRLHRAPEPVGVEGQDGVDGETVLPVRDRLGLVVVEVSRVHDQHRLGPAGGDVAERLSDGAAEAGIDAAERDRDDLEVGAAPVEERDLDLEGMLPHVSARVVGQVR
jgi:lysophospholipase L1-like esterase